MTQLIVSNSGKSETYNLIHNWFPNEGVHFPSYGVTIGKTMWSSLWRELLVLQFTPILFFPLAQNFWLLA